MCCMAMSGLYVLKWQLICYRFSLWGLLLWDKWGTLHVRNRVNFSGSSSCFCIEIWTKWYHFEAPWSDCNDFKSRVKYVNFLPSPTDFPSEHAPVSPYRMHRRLDAYSQTNAGATGCRDIGLTMYLCNEKRMSQLMMSSDNESRQWQWTMNARGCIRQDGQGGQWWGARTWMLPGGVGGIYRV